MKDRRWLAASISATAEVVEIERRLARVAAEETSVAQKEWQTIRSIYFRTMPTERRTITPALNAAARRLRACEAVASALPINITGATAPDKN